MKRFLIYTIFIISCFVLQGTLFKFLDFGNISPNLLLVLTVSLGLMRGRKTGLLVGFFSGFLMDIFLSSYIGLFSLLLMYCGYVAGFFNKIFFAEDIKLPIFLISLSDLIYGFLVYLIMFLLRGKMNLSYYFLHVCIPECIYTILITVVFYPLILLINQALETKERKQAKKFV